MNTLGIEITRRRLPELVAAAHRGETTVITRHGQPVAALVPIEQIAAMRPRPTALLALKGSAAGVWGDRPSEAVAALRDEWDRA